MAKHEVDAVSRMATTGHEWDGIKELNTPLPRWWVWLFYATILWSFGYWVLYPAWPTISGYTTGVLGYTNRTQIAADLADLQKLRGDKAVALQQTSLADIEKDSALLAFAQAQGKAAFANNCAPCHGVGATGGFGYPNLNDDDWLWGGTITAIRETIAYGVRSGNEKGHESAMPGFGKNGILKPDEIVAVANYVRSLSDLPVRPGVDLAKGKATFADSCSSCHGDDGKGNQDLGAPNLTDRIWLFGAEEAAIIDTITNGRAGVMPAWTDRLDPATINALAVYVHTLGGGK
ncbi:MAG TPA: cytochrome-c oxidase, cbb3-type subunit III [Xanthobacteraceae bacterium]|nr:cytochrome-c oxidase, cbb3-type subunit III [Xanthobacteraceae bacterium]